VRKALIRIRQSEDLFLWGFGFFALPWLISRPQEGPGEECGRDSLLDFLAAGLCISISNCVMIRTS